MQSFPGDHVQSFPGDHVQSFPNDHIESFPGDYLQTFPTYSTLFRLEYIPGTAMTKLLLCVHV